MKGSALILLAALFSGACAPSRPAAVEIASAWVRLPAVPGRPGAGYFTIRGGPAPARLLGVTSARVARIALHESMGGGGHGMAGMATMRPLPHADVAAGATLAFAPGGAHAMLFGIDPAIMPGGTLPLEFRFADGTRRSVGARVIAAGDPAP